MGRPRRPALELQLVRELAKRMGRQRSISAIAQDIAARVAADALFYADNQGEDPFLDTLFQLEGSAGLPAIKRLGRDAEIDVIAEITKMPVQRFQDRGCRQISGKAWEQESQTIMNALAAKLARRYARHLEKNIP